MCPLYDVDRRGWIELQPMSVARLGHGVVAAGQFGLKRSFKKKKVLDWLNKHLLFGRAFLPVTHIWWQLVSCPSEGFLFVMGGEDENKTVLDSGEKYDPDSNTWCPIPTMLQVCPPVSRGVLLRTRHLVLTFVFPLPCCTVFSPIGQLTPWPLGVSNAAVQVEGVALLRFLKFKPSTKPDKHGNVSRNLWINNYLLVINRTRWLQFLKNNNNSELSEEELSFLVLKGFTTIRTVMYVIIFFFFQGPL